MFPIIIGGVSMQVKTIAINNLASFKDFKNDIEFKKNNILFGTNGSGKSTLTSLLQHIANYKDDPSRENELIDFLKKHLSKENSNDPIDIKIVFTASEINIHYDPIKNSLTVDNGKWYPIKVFNDNYTDRNIGESIELRLSESGLLIGEENKELETLMKRKSSIEEEINNLKDEATKLVKKTEIEFRKTTNSTSNIDDILCVQNLLNDICDYTYNSDLITQRNKLGFGKQEKNIFRFIEINPQIKIDAIEERCQESVYLPNIEPDLGSVLKNYTNFFLNGVRIFEESNNPICPFCRREWKDADTHIEEYKRFLKSDFSQKRNEISNYKVQLEDYRRRILEQCGQVNQKKEVVIIEGNKYGIDVSSWQHMNYNDELHNKIINILDEKYNHMEKKLSIKNLIQELFEYHSSILNNNNKIILAIDEAIDSITSQRRKLNNAIAQHLTKKIWNEFAEKRLAYVKLNNMLRDINIKIKRLEENEKSQDTICTVFNGLLHFIGLEEYSISNDKRLRIRLENEYDISNEGSRISTAQRKILSLCYFFADVISSVKDIKELEDYILVFDDPVDSADYIFFHSITSVIEKSEIILAKILKKNVVKIGQSFVFTHNVLLYDRLACNWGKGYNKNLVKQNNITCIVKSEKKINNYALYLDEIIKYLQNPKSDTRRMTFIGNIIRRILEILCSFDNLGSNEFQAILDGMGKSKLAILANHMSHESFTKVLNPLSDCMELKEACQQLLEVIRERHPYQYDYIKQKYQISA